MVNLLTVKATKISMTCALTSTRLMRYEMEAECVNQIRLSHKRSKWDFVAEGLF